MRGSLRRQAGKVWQEQVTNDAEKLVPKMKLFSAQSQRVVLSSSFLNSNSRRFAGLKDGAQSFWPQPAPFRISGSHSKYQGTFFSVGFAREKHAFKPLMGFAAFGNESHYQIQTDSVGVSVKDEEGEVKEEEAVEDEGIEDEEEAHLEEEEAIHPDVLTTAKGELKPGLYLVGTPIGNLEDITLRALRVLKSASCILAEDTRHSAKLLRHYGIHTPTMSYHKFNECARRDELIQRLQRGDVLALISDAGMPGISDPGSELVKACVEVNVQVFPVPGPSAALTALVASGLPTDEFSFVGFLSTQSSSRKQRLAAAAKESATQIFYVPPHKLCRLLDDFILAFGSSRRCAVAREMTKLHEEFWRGTLEGAKIEFDARRPRGELTLIVQGLPKRLDEHLASEDELRSRLQELMEAGMGPSEASKQVVEETSARRNVVYSIALEIRRRPHSAVE